ncbi:ROK family protein [Streptomyces sp. N2-109]|uniref:ROK family protein n=1 Tax=Streptomyces gossypii TaxID=2883101 RepID=A0ABT2JS49_9ACTN|nr:ROK family protein [Streptomyces gossypii]MCT2590712.1 ROK family protein [Streptomyces gossypii]
MTRVPVLEVGGTHVTAALVDMTTGLPVADSVVRRPVSADAGAAEILDSFAAAARHIAAPDRARWGVAVPGPFDYAAGIGRFRGIGKFESLHDIDVGAGLRDRLPHPRAISFLNDADAFAIGEHHSGAAVRRNRSLCVTLGTGVGSSFLHDGRPVTEGPTVPPGGRAHRITVDGLPLEEVISRRAIRARYARTAGLDGRTEGPDVSAIAALARGADRHAAAAISGCFTTLGRALAPWCAVFRPDVMVVGGSMAASWDLIGPALRSGLTTGAEAAGPGADARVAAMDLRAARRPDDAPLIGAAHWALRRRTGCGPPEPDPLAAEPAPFDACRSAHQ